MRAVHYARGARAVLGHSARNLIERLDPRIPERGTTSGQSNCWRISDRDRGETTGFGWLLAASRYADHRTRPNLTSRVRPLDR